MMPPIHKSTQNPAIRLGLLFGGILGAIHVVFNFVNNLANLQGIPYTWLNYSLLILVALCLLLAGFFTRQVRAGALAGLSAGLVSAGIGILSLWLVTLSFMDIISQHSFWLADFPKTGLATIEQFIIEDTLSGSVAEFAASVIFGIILGIFGGWIGSLTSRRASAPTV